MHLFRSSVLVSRLTGVFLFAFVSSLSTYALEWKLQSINFYGTAIELAIPVDFTPAPADEPRMRFTEKALPPTNRLIAGAISSVNRGHYCLVQQVVATKEWRYNAADWNALLGQFDSTLKGLSMTELSESINRRVNEALGEQTPGAALRIEKPVILPAIDSSDHHITFPMLLAINFDQSKDSNRQVVLCAVMIFALKGRMVHAFLYEPFVGKETYTVVAEKAREMAKRTLAAN